MPKAELGRLVRLSATDAFQNEPADFTPWLAENLGYLSEELGLDLRLQAREHPVGRYSLDLLLEDATGRVVIIENQFNRTDHGHLGQLLTYCAGTKAQVVVWIAEHMTDEHVAALEWLNESTLPGIGFFGVELEIVRIGESAMAPHFRVLVQPNDWSKAIRADIQRSVAQWNWDAYRDHLQISPAKLSIGRHVSDLIQECVDLRGLPWTLRFNKGYVALQRSSGYNVMAVDLWSYRIPRLKIKLPAPLAELNERNPFPELQTDWDRQYKEQWWALPAVGSVASMAEAIDLAARYQPSSGPLVTAQSDEIVSEDLHGNSPQL